MKKKKIKKLIRVIPEIGGEIGEFLAGDDSFMETVIDISERASEICISEENKDKEKKKSRRLFSVDQLEALSSILAIKNASEVDEKFAIKSTEWLIYDYVNECFRMYAKIPHLGIKKPIYLSLGGFINLEHASDENFVVTFANGSLMYNHATESITDYTKGDSPPWTPLR